MSQTGVDCMYLTNLLERMKSKKRFMKIHFNPRKLNQYLHTNKILAPYPDPPMLPDEKKKGNRRKIRIITTIIGPHQIS